MEELDGEERVAPGVVVERLAESRPQTIRRGVDVGLDKGSPIHLVQIDPDVAPPAAEFAQDDAHTRCSLRLRAEAPTPALDVQRLRPARARHQDSTSAQMPSQVEEQRRRTAVGPLQVVNQQQQRPALETVCSTRVTWAKRSVCGPDL